MIIADVATPDGDARLWTDEADDPWLRLVLGHGAGGGPRSRDLAALAERLLSAGISVIRVEQPWRVAEKKIAPRPEVLDRAWLAVLDSVARDLPVAVGGRSAGARVACRTAKQVDAIAVVSLAFPLHPPGKPERSRFAELADAGVPTLVVQGARDPFGHPEEFPAGSHRVVAVPHADHALAVPKSQNQSAVLAGVAQAVRSWLVSTVSTA